MLTKRSDLLPFSFQARIGNMDGVLVAYHNTARIFGFQYVSLEEMEERIYGSGNGMRVFNKCVSFLERVLGDVVSIYGERVGLFHSALVVPLEGIVVPTDTACSPRSLERQMHFRDTRVEPGAECLDPACRMGRRSRRETMPNHGARRSSGEFPRWRGGERRQGGFRRSWM